MFPRIIKFHARSFLISYWSKLFNWTQTRYLHAIVYFFYDISFLHECLRWEACSLPSHFLKLLTCATKTPSIPSSRIVRALNGPVIFLIFVSWLCVLMTQREIICQSSDKGMHDYDSRSDIFETSSSVNQVTGSQSRHRDHNTWLSSLFPWLSTTFLFFCSTIFTLALPLLVLGLKICGNGIGIHFRNSGSARVGDFFPSLVLSWAL